MDDPNGAMDGKLAIMYNAGGRWSSVGRFLPLLGSKRNDNAARIAARWRGQVLLPL